MDFYHLILINDDLQMDYLIDYFVFVLIINFTYFHDYYFILQPIYFLY